MTELKRYLTLEEVAERWNLPPKRLREQIKRYAIPVLRAGRSIRFDDIALQALEEAFAPVPAEPPAPLLSSIPIPTAGGNPGFVYFIQAHDNGPIKIGFAIDIKQRLKALQTASFVPLRLVGFVSGSYDLERQNLARFATHKLIGEWHLAVDELIAFIRDEIRDD